MGTEVNHDHALSEFYVYNDLHGRAFLKSRDALIAEPHELREIRHTATEAFDQDRFQAVWIELSTG